MKAVDVIVDPLLALIPEDSERARLADLLRIGVAFKSQHQGRRRGFLYQYLFLVVSRLGDQATFERLLEELEIEAARRDLHGPEASPIERVNRVMQMLTFHHPRKGRSQVAFGTLRNKFTACKKEAFTECAKP